MTEGKHLLTHALIERALRGGPRSLPELAVAIGGMYPADLKPILAELEAQNSIFFSDGTYRLPSSSPQHVQINGLPTLGLLPPHPANMDWRYDVSTARLVVERSLAASDGAGLLIGSPSALVQWRELAPTRPALLLDASEKMVASINCQTINSVHQALRFDMCRPLDWHEEQKYDVCVCDPPWYREHYLGAMGIASLALRLGASMLVSLLPALARPGASVDRHWIMQQADQLGFHLFSLEQNALRYVTPQFERQSLAVVGIDVPQVWRCGDLATFVKVREVDGEVRVAALMPLANMELAERDLSEILVRGQMWRLRGPFDDPGITPELIPIEPNNILPTVSRRYEGRSKIGLWLPDNRVFGIRGRAAFWHALRQLENPGLASLPSRPEDATIVEALRLLEPLLATNEEKADPKGGIL